MQKPPIPITALTLAVLALMAAMAAPTTYAQTPGQPPPNVQRIDLAGDEWTLRAAGDTTLLPATVPGNAFTDLMANGLIDDPLTGTTEQYVQWVSQIGWVYERTFIHVDSGFMRQPVQELVIEGVDTYAEIFWNGERLGRCGNAFRTYRFSVRGRCRSVNRLQVVFYAPSHVEAAREARYGLELPGGSRVFSRKPAYQYGWDWGPRLVGTGLTGSVALEAWGGVRILGGGPMVEDITGDEVTGYVQLHIRAAAEGMARCNVRLDGRPVVLGEDVPLTPGAHTLRLPFRLDRARLWWPWDLGTPHLYTAEVEIDMMTDGPTVQLARDRAEYKWGLRRVQLITQPDSLGESFGLEVNGVPVFARGANYIPQDLFTHRPTPADYRRTLGDARAANMNTLRVWGGGIYERDLFYELCDSLGLLVWQDFMFACAMYPGTRWFLDNVREEAEGQLRRLAGHPSVALWCGNNEVSEAWARWGWQEDFKPAQRKRIERAYHALFVDLLPELVDSLGGGPDYCETSPRYGRGDPRFNMAGSAHDWGVWHDGLPFERFEEKVPRFMSEYGFQAWPSLSVLDDFHEVGNRQAGIAHHEKHPRGFEIMEAYRQRYYPAPGDLIDTVYISQLVQAHGIGMGAEAHRRAKPRCMGSLYWQLNDCWPAISWSGIDSRGHWKALHKRMQTAFSPVLYSLEVGRDSAVLWGVNDTRKTVGDTVRLTWWLDGTMPVALHVIPTQLKPMSAQRIQAFPVRRDLLGADTSRIMVSWQSGEAGEPGEASLVQTAFLVRPGEYTAEHRPLEVTCKRGKAGVFHVNLQSTSIHTQVYLPPEILLRQTDNFQTVMPGRPLTIATSACPAYWRAFPVPAGDR